MAIHVTDPKTDAAVRKLAQLTGHSLTDAIRTAVEEKLETLTERTEENREEAVRRLLSYAVPRGQEKPLDERYRTLSHKELTDLIWDEDSDL